MKHKSVPRFKSRARDYPFAASFRVHYPRPSAGLDEEQAAARAISDGDYLGGSVFREDVNMVYLFRTSAQAHAMQIWFEANARPYDDWEDKVLSWESSRRARKEREDLVNAAAATGMTDRLRPVFRTQGARAAAQLLHELEPTFHADAAESAVAILFGR